MNYRLLDLSTLAPMEPAGPLPTWLVEANPSPDQITDLGWSGRTGQGYFPIIIADDPPFDPDTHRLSDPVEGKPDPKTKTIPAVREVVALTAEEIAARNPVPAILGKVEFITLVQMAGGMTDEMLVDAHANPMFAAFWIKMQMASVVQRDYPTTASGLDALAFAGYLPRGKAAVLAAWPAA